MDSVGPVRFLEFPFSVGGFSFFRRFKLLGSVWDVGSVRKYKLFIKWDRLYGLGMMALIKFITQTFWYFWYTADWKCSHSPCANCFLLLADCLLVGVPPVLTLEGVESHVLNCDSPTVCPFNTKLFPKHMPFLLIPNPYIDLLYRNDERVKLWGFLLRNTCISILLVQEDGVRMWMQMQSLSH